MPVDRSAEIAERLKGIGRDMKVRLEVAARLAFPDGSISLSSLRREAKKGRLTVWRVANKDMTTLAEIDRMLDLCRVPPSQPACGSDRPEDAEPPYGSSSTVDVSIAQAAARMRAEKLRDAFKTTSLAKRASSLPPARARLRD